MKKYILFFSLLFLMTGCFSRPAQEDYILESPFETFRDIPGLTREEKEAVAAVLADTVSFSYGMTMSSEAFLDENDTVHGFSAHVTEWLTGLFGVPFIPEVHDWHELTTLLDNNEIDFAGNMTINEQRRQEYILTDAITRRNIQYLMLADSPPLNGIIAVRAPRFGFLENSVTYDFVVPHIRYEYEYVFVPDYKDAVELLNSGEIDAFIGESSALAAYENAHTVLNNFYPPQYSPIGIATANEAFRPIINAIQAALENGGAAYLSQLYAIGSHEFLKYRLLSSLSDEERAFIEENPVVMTAVQTDNYPISFYNRHENEFQGIAIDILSELSDITGLRFEYNDDPNESWTEKLGMLENGGVQMMAELIWTNSRERIYEFSHVPFFTDNMALISRNDYPHINISDIVYLNIALVKDSSFLEIFTEWFPDHSNISIYDTTFDAFDAVGSGEADMALVSSTMLLMLTHYLERAEFKVNLMFDYPFESLFGFNADEVMLRNIIDKALLLIDTEWASNYWLYRTFDYRAKVAEGRLPWLIGVTVMSLLILALIFILFLRKHGEGKRLGIMVAEQTLEIRNASQAKTDFLANMNHEIRTPANAIVGFTELLLEENVSQEVREYLLKIYTAGYTLMGLINDILDISKIEAGKFTLTPVHYEMASLLNDVITINIFRIKEKPITFKLNLADDLYINLFGDDMCVKQVISNLLSNAFKYTRQGNVTLDVSNKRDGEDVVLTIVVSDTGLGMRKEDLAKLFTNYNQVDTKANRSIEGTGLGLAITKNIVNLMNGEISVESEYGIGTTFTVAVRQGFVSDEIINDETLKNLCDFHYVDDKKLGQNLHRPDLSHAKVLVVDDYHSNLEVARGLLAKYKIKAVCVSSGQEAIAQINAENPRFDIVFMDHMMPGMDGIETVEIIRGMDSEYAKTVPIIAFTANTVAGYDQLFLEKGFQGFLAKPVSVKKLDAVVHKWISKTPAMPEIPEEQASEIPGINMAAALELYDNDNDLLIFILRSFVKNVPAVLEKLRALSNEEASLPAYTTSIHAVKGNCGSVGAEQLAARAKEMETLAREGNHIAVMPLNGPFIADAEELIKRINSWLPNEDT